MCGARKEWGERTVEACKNAHVRLRKVSFVTNEGGELIRKAIEKGVGRLPFVTDGEHFAYDAKSVLEAQSEAKEVKKTAKAKKTTKRKGEGSK